MSVPRHHGPRSNVSIRTVTAILVAGVVGITALAFPVDADQARPDVTTNEVAIDSRDRVGIDSGRSNAVAATTITRRAGTASTVRPAADLINVTPGR